MRKLSYAVAILSFLSVGAVAAQAESLDEIRAFVTKVTNDLPIRFDGKGFASPKQMEGHLPSDIMAYARFYWALDNIEGVCEFIGQRSNIEMVEPRIINFLAYPELRDEHPDRQEYIRISELFDKAVETIGEDTLCPDMYRMFGPNGNLMGNVLRINGLLGPKLRNKYMVHVEDGVLWSTRDYCERRFHLEPPANQAWHDFTCAKAKEQKF